MNHFEEEFNELLKLIEEKNFYFCVIDAPITNEKTSSVMIDHKKGQYEVAKSIIEPQYCKKVLYLAGKKNGYVTDMRIEGIMQLQKELGFNLLRKHIKVEPETFYYACDRLGMLVMQDFVNNGPYNFMFDTVIPTYVSKKRNDSKFQTK